jgi:hypothetical protein
VEDHVPEFAKIAREEGFSALAHGVRIYCGGGKSAMHNGMIKLKANIDAGKVFINRD